MAKSSTGSPSKPASNGTDTTRKRSSPFLTPSAAPAAVRRAARFMFAGSVGSLAWGIYALVVNVTLKNSYFGSLAGKEKLTKAQFDKDFVVLIAIDILFALVGAVLWAWMARLCQGGRNAARIASTVLFLIWTYYTYQTISGLGAWVVLGVLVIDLVIWGFGAAALYYLWRPESTAFFKRQQAA